MAEAEMDWKEEQNLSFPHVADARNATSSQLKVADQKNSDINRIQGALSNNYLVNQIQSSLSC